MTENAVHAHQMTNTHLLVQDFAYLEPSSLQEAISLLVQYGERARILAGGTYLLVQMKMERQAPEVVINVGRLPELGGLSSRDGRLHVGAGTSIYALRLAQEVRAGYAALAEACAAFGSAQIQVMGTLGGNLCNGSPASDTVPALLALDAQLLLAGPDGERRLPVHEFLLGPGATALRRGELLVSVVLPPPRPGTGSAFLKLSRVQADLAKVSAAAVLVRDGDRVLDCRLAFGSVAPTVLRAREAERLLIGQAFSPRLALEAGAVASREVAPIDDVRSSAWYRRQVIQAVAHDVLCQAWDRAGESANQRVSDSATPSTPAGRPTPNTRYPISTTQSPELRAGASDPTPSTLHIGPQERHPITLTVNGVQHHLSVAPNELLLNVLRERLELTGSKYGCGIGECGACTVHLNGMPALACLTLAVAADGAEVLTVEGLQGPDGELHPLQDAFIEHQAFQCGYCTPGMLMMSKSLLDRVPSPTEEDVRAFLRGNRCRCTGFASIVRAVLSCADGKEA
jgi:xanthine dehydrogenase iron-sulfur cluster and FAD-binding subunit A